MNVFSAVVEKFVEKVEDAQKRTLDATAIGLQVATGGKTISHEVLLHQEVRSLLSMPLQVPRPGGLPARLGVDELMSSRIDPLEKVEEECCRAGGLFALERPTEPLACRSDPALTCDSRHDGFCCECCNLGTHSYAAAQEFGCEVNKGAVFGDCRVVFEDCCYGRGPEPDKPTSTALFATSIATSSVVHTSILGGDKKDSHEEFVPTFDVRTGCLAKWYVDGEDYMAAILDAISGARMEILIADWQLNPDIYLKRSKTGIDEDSLQWRLDHVLLRKAKSGVKVYILLYYESRFLPNGSKFARSRFAEPGNNIEVVLHPRGYRHMLWSHHEKIVVVDRRIAFIGGIDLAFGRWDTHNHCCVDNYPDLKSKSECHQTWMGKDYKNVFVVDEKDPEKPFEDYTIKKQALRTACPRMPWHDIMCSIKGSAVMDVVHHFIQRYNANKERHQPGLDEDRWAHIAYGFYAPPSETVTVQVLRSVGQWSIGRPTEASIQWAYIDAINNAEHFIYIENQFFISSQPAGKMLGEIKNQIMSALADRIVKAHRRGETFRVIIVMPLKPECHGDWDGYASNGLILRELTRLTYATLFKGDNSLRTRLINKNVPPEKVHQYFSVYGLRTHDELKNESLVTEVVYVHSKVMIVDDRISIIGSANINDRSMLGDRDSEIAVMITDRNFVDGEMNGIRCQVGKFSHSLRCRLFREHLGLLEEGSEMVSVDDPIISKFYNDHWRKVAEENTQIYEEVFGGAIDPSSSVEKYKDLKRWKKQTGKPYTEALKKLKKVRGHLVLFPERFLIKESLKSVYTYPLDYSEICHMSKFGDIHAFEIAMAHLELDVNDD